MRPGEPLEVLPPLEVVPSRIPDEPVPSRIPDVSEVTSRSRSPFKPLPLVPVEPSVIPVPECFPVIPEEPSVVPVPVCFPVPVCPVEPTPILPVVPTPEPEFSKLLTSPPLPDP